jgi:hypothetical protein
VCDLRDRARADDGESKSVCHCATARPRASFIRPCIDMSREEGAAPSRSGALDGA